MSPRKLTVVALAVAVTWFVANNIPPSTAHANQGHGGPQKWEYTTIGLQGPTKDQLNNLGDAGWEVCGVVPTDSDTKASVILKRPK